MAEYRLTTGTLTAAALNAGSYLLSQFPVQSDQISAYVNPWECITDEGTTFPAYTRYVSNSDLSERADGFIRFNWNLAYLTEGMVSYLETLFFSTYLFNQVTVKTLRQSGVYTVYNATLLLPNPAELKRAPYGGILDYPLRFVGGVVAA